MQTLTPVAPHAHHWIIETPNGPECRGICKICRTLKPFVSGFHDDGDFNFSLNAPDFIRGATKAGTMPEETDPFWDEQESPEQYYERT